MNGVWAGSEISYTKPVTLYKSPYNTTLVSKDLLNNGVPLSRMIKCIYLKAQQITMLHMYLHNYRDL